MYLSELKLWNFRKYGRKTNGSEINLEQPDLIVPFNRGINVLIGANDSGKSAILDAIKLVLKTHAYEWIKVENEDFYRDSLTLRIELKFNGLSNNEASHFTEWLGWGEEVIIDHEGNKKNEIRPLLRLIYHVRKDPIQNNRILPADVKAGMDEQGLPLSAEAREYLKATYLRALRNAEVELTAKKNSRISEILQGHRLFKERNEEEHTFIRYANDFNEKLESWFNDTNESDGKVSNKKQIKDVIDEFLQQFIAKNSESAFTLSDPNIKSVLEKISLVIKDGYFNYGLGTLNRLYMAAELLHLRKEHDEIKLCLIEELEAHLHPQAQMKVIQALEKEKQVQFILTTHSPNLASKVNVEDIIICSDDDVYPLMKGMTGLGKDDYVHLKRFLDVTKSNLFFANGIIIVEGWSEEILIPEIARKIDCDLAENEVSIINVGSTEYLRFARIFMRNDHKKMNINVSVVSDIDLREYEREAKVDENGLALKEGNRNVYVYSKQNVTPESIEKVKNDRKEKFDGHENIKVCVSDKWTFEWCLLQSTVFSDAFKEVLKEVHPDVFSGDDINWEESLARVLLSKSIKKTEIAHKLSDRIGTIDFSTMDITDSFYYVIDAIKHACGKNDN